LINRFISDEELIELYKVSDTIWACYAPSYDQASGIFGRAVQFSVPVIVRDGSQVSKLSRFLNHSTTTITWGDPDAAAHQIISEFQKRGSEADIGTNTASLRGHSLSTLGKALGLNISDEDFNSDIRSKDGT
jgi:hypothetical protein